MTFFVFLALMAVAAAVIALATSRSWPDSIGARGREVLSRVRDETPGVLAAGVVLVLGLTAIVFVMWPLGLIVKHGENQIDHPIYKWFCGGSLNPIPSCGSATDLWTRINVHFTTIGDWAPIKVAAFVAAVVFMVWRKDKRWVPPLVFLAAFWAEKLVQTKLAHLVDRGHPVGVTGTWPSGGSARVLLVYGLIAYFLLNRINATRRTRVIVWSVVWFLEMFEEYTRVYVGKHWVTDVIPGGLLFGSALIAIFLAAAWILDNGYTAAMPKVLHQSGSSAGGLTEDRSKAEQIA